MSLIHLHEMNEKFSELHPYGLTADQIKIVIWILFTCIIAAVFAFVASIIKSHSGRTSSNIMQIRHKTVVKAKKNKETRKETQNP